MQKSTNLGAYSAFIRSLNGRFGYFFPSKDRRPEDLTDITNLSRQALNFGLAISIVCAILIVIDHTPDLARFYQILLSSPIGIGFVILGKSLFVVYASVFFWRLCLVACYRPTKACSDRELPNCTIIVPAYNEGRQVLHTLRSIVRSDIPAKKLQIIAVDDGSKDDTWRWIQKAARCFPGRIEAIHMEKNGGKRKALYQGFMRATGKVIVTIDSDSLVEPHTVRRLISPFCRDKNVGGVAGCVRVLNLHQGLIPRFLDVAFAFSFDFYRASQSQVDTVLCTPGALSAYLKKPLMANLDAWMNQTFMGRPSTIGEDRAMTNFILKDGYSVKFQSDAIVYTNVPTAYKQLCKMLLRWARSNIRETLYMATYIFKTFRRNGGMTGARVNFVTAVLGTFIPRLLITAAILLMFARPDIWIVNLLAGALIATLVQGTFYFIRRRSLDALLAFPYSLFAAIGLSWIATYALLTPGNGSWLTRELVSTDTHRAAKAENIAALGSVA